MKWLNKHRLSVDSQEDVPGAEQVVLGGTGAR